MKKVLVVLFVMLLMACDSGSRISNERVGGKTVVRIERAVHSKSNPYLTFSAESAVLNYDERRIEVDGVVSITGDQDFLTAPTEWAVPKVEVKNSKIIIPIPKDADYHIYIGKQYHLLPKIVEEKK